MKDAEDEAFDELAKRQGGGFKAKQAMAADKQHWNEEEWRRNEWRCGHGWLRGEQCEICNAAQEPVECLDCGSHNVGVPATYDSLVNSVKAQPAQEPVAWMNKHGACISAVFKEVEETAGEYTTPLYTTPPPREWVGLTDDDKAELAKAQHSWEDLCLAVEAKLKEKNNG